VPVIRFIHRHITKDNYPCSDKEHNPTIAIIELTSSCKPTDCHPPQGWSSNKDHLQSNVRNSLQGHKRNRGAPLGKERPFSHWLILMCMSQLSGKHRKTVLRVAGPQGESHCSSKRKMKSTASCLKMKRFLKSSMSTK